VPDADRPARAREAVQVHHARGFASLNPEIRGFARRTAGLDRQAPRGGASSPRGVCKLDAKGPAQLFHRAQREKGEAPSKIARAVRRDESRPSMRTKGLKSYRQIKPGTDRSW